MLTRNRPRSGDEVGDAAAAPACAAAAPTGAACCRRAGARSALSQVPRHSGTGRTAPDRWRARRRQPGARPRCDPVVLAQARSASVPANADWRQAVAWSRIFRLQAGAQAKRCDVARIGWRAPATGTTSGGHDQLLGALQRRAVAAAARCMRWRSPTASHWVSAADDQDAQQQHQEHAPGHRAEEMLSRAAAPR